MSKNNINSLWDLYNHNHYRTKRKQYLLLGQLFEDYPNFLDFMNKQNINPLYTTEDIYDFIFVRYSQRRTIFNNYREVFIEIVKVWREMIADFENIARVQSLDILSALNQGVITTQKGFSTNDIGEDDDNMNIQFLGKNTNDITTKDSIANNTTEFRYLFDLFGEQSYNQYKKLIKKISHNIQ